jgi:predicted XRE-type DNA-binding protein
LHARTGAACSTSPSSSRTTRPPEKGSSTLADSLGDSLERALETAFTRRIPQSAQAHMKYLIKQLKFTKAAAQALGVSQRTVERYVAGKFKRPAATCAAA